MIVTKNFIPIHWYEIDLTNRIFVTIKILSEIDCFVISIKYVYTTFINITRKLVIVTYSSQPDDHTIYIFIEPKMFKLNMKINHINQYKYYTRIYISVIVVWDSTCVC